MNKIGLWVGMCTLELTRLTTAVPDPDRPAQVFFAKVLWAIVKVSGTRYKPAFILKSLEMDATGQTSGTIARR